MTLYIECLSKHLTLLIQRLQKIYFDKFLTIYLSTQLNFEIFVNRCINFTKTKNSITCISDPAHDQVETAGHDPDVDVEEADHEPNQVVQVECNMRIPKKIFDYMGKISFEILM